MSIRKSSRKIWCCVAGVIRQQDDLGIVSVREIRLRGSLCTASFGEQANLSEKDSSVGERFTLRPQCSQRVGAPRQGQQLLVRLFLVHHLHFMREEKKMGGALNVRSLGIMPEVPAPGHVYQVESV